MVRIFPQRYRPTDIADEARGENELKRLPGRQPDCGPKAFHDLPDVLTNVHLLAARCLRYNLR